MSGGERPEDDLLAPDMLENYTGVAMPAPLASLKGKEVLHTGVIDKSDMQRSVLNFAKE